jgi:hypothetical protein
MRKGALAAVAATLLALLLAPAAGASHDPSGAPFDEDFVVGTGTVLFMDVPLGTISFDAQSGPEGENPRGTITAVSRFGDRITTPVTCLNVNEHRAVVGTSSLFVIVEDSAVAGAADTESEVLITGGGAPTTCPPDPPGADPPRIMPGDVVVHDAVPLPTSKGQCKNGGWRNFPGFKNQGECVSFVEHRPQP